MPFIGESRSDPEDGFTRHNREDNQFYATPTIFNPAKFPWFQASDAIQAETWPREVWPIPQADRERWREVMEIRERDRRAIMDAMELPYVDRMLLTTPNLKQHSDEFVCSICLEDLKEGENAIRLDCTHVFHAACKSPAI